MFNARELITKTPGLNLPDGYDIAPLVDLVSQAYFAGADASGDQESDAVQGLISALKSIEQVTSDPVARSKAAQALEVHKAMSE